MIVFISILFLLSVFVYAFLSQPKFGKLPSGNRLASIQRSPNYRNGSFQNRSHTPDLTEGVSYWNITKEFLFKKKSRIKPTDKIPSYKTNLHALNREEDVLIWFGHSSYYFQIDGKRILVDPVFSGSASPLPFGTKAFHGTDIYSTEDIPEIDYLFISHDHWDHLDYDTILKLKPKIKQVICGLGVGAHFEHWGYDSSLIIETDWHEQFALSNGFVVHTVSARHFSGRGLKRNKSLWMSYVLQTPSMQIFIGGDSGYDNHFDEIGKTFGTFDFVILENGQYDEKWKYIHLMPYEILQVAKQLNAKRILPVHSSKFVLGNHPWDEPLELIIQNNEKEKLNIITPRIGEKIQMKDTQQKFSNWWQAVK